jgi:hypothetical protein
MMADLTNFNENMKELQNPKQLEYVFGGPKSTFWGIHSHTSYRAGEGDIINVDERDYEYLLSLFRRARPYFAPVPNKVEKVKEEEYLENIENEVLEEIREYEEETGDMVFEDELLDLVDTVYDEFDTVKGISMDMSEKIHDLGVHTFVDLHDKGVDWLQELPGIGTVKALNIYSEIERKIVGDKY